MKNVDKRSTEPVNFIVSSELKQKIRKAAELDGRSMTSYIKRVLEQAVNITFLKAREDKMHYEGTDE